VYFSMKNILTHFFSFWRKSKKNDGKN